jgi:two-component system CheB/CheR fusion protein
MSVALYVGSEIVIKMANQEMLRTWGKDESVIGKTVYEALPELEGQPFYQLLKNVFNTGIPYQSTDDRVDLEVDGHLQTFYYNFTYKPLKNAQDKVWGILNTATNVTQQVLAKIKIEESERNFRNMILQSPVAMCIFRGPSFIVEIANERMFELWGKAENEVINKSIFEGLPEVKEEGFQRILKNVYESGKTYTESERPVPLPRNGKVETVYVNFSYQAIKDADIITGILAVAIEVTDQVIARHKVEENEAELRVTKKRLELELEAGKQVQKQKDDFIGIASHELKTPLTSLNSSLQLLNRMIKNDPASPKVQTLLNLSNVSIHKLINLLEDLLNDTKINEGQLELRKRPFKVSKLIEDCCNHVRSAGTHQLVTTGDLNLVVSADMNRVDQVLVNLVNNAVKYAPDSKEIEIHIERLNNGVKVSVIDKGPGIAAEKQIHLFKRYYRIDTTGIQYSGLGLGLFISSEIIKRHGGEIGVESTLGEGSTFWFTLPDSIPPENNH